jgi:predicted small lipoprotein YifL
VNRRRALRALSGAALVAGIATGCGQTGPLYLPEEKLDELERKRRGEKSGRAPSVDRGPRRA